MIKPSRRDVLGVSGAVFAAAIAEPAGAAPAAGDGFCYCLNTATLSGYRLPLPAQIETAAKAGYQAIEPWVSDIHEYGASGGSLADLRKRIGDLGLTVESGIAFPEWIVNDPARSAKGMEQARRDMDALLRIGGKRIAMPPAGAGAEAIPLPRITERYRAVLEVGDQMGITPELEFWGMSAQLSRLSQAVDIAIEAAHPKACVLADVFHLYKGGSGFSGLRLVSGQAIQVLHMNDYPATPPREAVRDSDRVYPGDGVAPFHQMVADLRRVAPRLVLSLELFNAAYWKGAPLETARTGLARMQSVVREAAG